MPTLNIHFDGPDAAAVLLVLAHGAGAPMDTPFMAAVAAGLSQRGLRVARFEFPYMARRRHDGGRPIANRSYWTTGVPCMRRSPATTAAGS